MGLAQGSPSFQVVPQKVSNSTSLLSHIVCPKFNFHVIYSEKVGHREHICFYFVTSGWSKDVLLFGSAQSSQRNGDGRINMATSKFFIKKCECTHGLINMSHNRCSPVKVLNKLFFFWKAKISDRLKWTRNRNSAQPMRNCSMDPIDSNCFLLGRVEACWIFLFPWSSQWVHNVFPNIFTIVPHLLPYVLPGVVLLEPILVGKTSRFMHFNVWHASWNTIMILVRKLSPLIWV
jgi:hypothetical protein